jgi:heme-degrading monooxygenase HmoA
MFSVIFEVHPKSDKWDAYLGYAKMLRPELEKIEGFVDNIRYRSLTREGWLLSLSGWKDEKALVRWRTKAVHHDVQEKGRTEVFYDYHLRVGQLTADTMPPHGLQIEEQRLDETEAGEGTTITLIDGTQTSDWVKGTDAQSVAEWLGLNTHAQGLTSWDVFDAVLSPGDIILLLSWRSNADAGTFEEAQPPRHGIRIRRVRVIRDYGMRDRREAPQYYPDVSRDPTR